MILLPQPRQLTRQQGTYTGSPTDPPTTRVDPDQVGQPQGYRLTITPKRIEIVGHDEPGVFYGEQTLRQIAADVTADHADNLPCVSIEDWPDFPHRGVMLDISRDKVPTMETLYSLIDLLASWKINEFQLYTEHTFAYPQHEEVWRDASPMTGQEIEALDRYCAQRFIELVPNQNSLGHVERFLFYDASKPLAEMPDMDPDAPADDPHRYRRRNGTTLNPIDPASIEFVDRLYDDLLHHFSSSRFNVGGDEPWELGKGRSKEQAEARGEGRVYLDFMLELYRRVTARGRTMMYWGDIIKKYPELIPELPADVVTMEWGYRAEHPFDEHCKRYAELGLPFYVCPGTSTWAGFTGRTDNALANLTNAAEAGKRHGAQGYLNTNWGDNGHPQPLPLSYLGFAWGAAAGWCLDSNAELDLCGALDRFAFRDDAGIMGRLVYDLGNAEREAGLSLTLNPVMRRILANPEAPIKLSADALESIKASVQSTISRLDQADMQRDDAELIRDEFQTMAEITLYACDLALARLNGDPPPDPGNLIERYENLWLTRSRPGGLKESTQAVFRAAIEE